MIDPVLYNADEGDNTYFLDINIVNGVLEEMPVPQNKNMMQQRKAVLAYQTVNSIPGDWERGVDWANIIATKDVMPMAEAMMQVQSAVTADDDEAAQTSFTVPIVTPVENAVSIQLMTVTQEDIQGGNGWLN